MLHFSLREAGSIAIAAQDAAILERLGFAAGESNDLLDLESGYSLAFAPGSSFIGARWDPSKANHLFVCNDISESTRKVDVFFKEDRLPVFAHVDQSPDPIFRPHKAILVRAVAATGEEAKDPRFVF